MMILVCRRSLFETLRPETGAVDDGENLDLRRGSLDSISDDERPAWHDEFPRTGDTARSAPIRMVRQIGRALADILMNPSRGARIMIMDVLVDPFEIA